LSQKPLNYLAALLLLPFLEGVTHFGVSLADSNPSLSPVLLAELSRELKFESLSSEAIFVLI